MPGEFAPEQDDLFLKKKANKKLKMGSYGIHVDSQLEALRKVKEAKEFAKAVKLTTLESWSTFGMTGSGWKASPRKDRMLL